MYRCTFILLVLFYSLSLIAQTTDTLWFPGEKHLNNVRQLTHGRQNAEGYLSFDETKLIFQSERDSFQCDQIYSMTLTGDSVTLLSTGKGKTTCSYFLPGDSTYLYASTHFGDPACPPRPDYSKGYVWGVYKSFDIFKAKPGNSQLQRMTTTDGYDAEATVSPKGDKIIFTSVRNGDLDLYSMDIDGNKVRQLTFETGYDGGAFYSWDGSQIVYRAYHPADSSEIADYTSLLADGFVRPSKMEIYVMNADGSNKRQLTTFGAASFAPFFLPDGTHIMFSSNVNDPKGRNFDLYTISTDGSGLEQVTFNSTFDGFPVFTHDGKNIIFASNRNATTRGETNIFIADWIP